jgi:hypothetical protein
MRLASYVPGELIPLPLSGSIPELPHVAKVGCDYDVIRPFRLGRRDLVPRHRRSLRNFYATQYTEPEWVAVAQPAMRAVADSGR